MRSLQFQSSSSWYAVTRHLWSNTLGLYDFRLPLDARTTARRNFFTYAYFSQVRLGIIEITKKIHKE